MVVEISRKARRQIRSIVNLCEEFGVRRLVGNLPARTILLCIEEASQWTFVATKMRAILLGKLE